MNSSKAFELFTKNTILSLMMTTSQLLYGATTPSTEANKIENVLDKLEQRLIDRELPPALSLHESEESSQSKPESSSSKKEKNKSGANKLQKYAPHSPAVITGKPSTERNLNELQKKISEYDNRIDVLESEVRNLRSGLYESANTDNQVKLDVKTQNESRFIIRTLIAKLDENTLYNQLDPAGLWMPTRSVSVFHGPLRPGDHLVEISATIAPLTDDGLQLPSWKQKTIAQTFKFSLPDGMQRRKITIELSDTKGDGSQPQAKLVESDLK